MPSAAFALGLGDIHLLSPLNAPLDAEIELVDVAPDELNTVQVQLASRETFAAYGLEWPAYLSAVQAEDRAHAAMAARSSSCKSTDPITEPFVTLLVEVNWARGRLVREYTMLLDPPVYAPGESAVASAPVAPAPPAPARAKDRLRARRRRPPRLAAPAPAEAPRADRPRQLPRPRPPPRPRQPPPARHAHAAASAGGGRVEGSQSHLVQRGETLSQIASGVAGARPEFRRKARSWMLAIYQANPQAFRQNMNVLRSGAVLRIPEASEAAAVSPGRGHRGDPPPVRRLARHSAGGCRHGGDREARPPEACHPLRAAPAAANATPPGPAATPRAKGARGRAAAAQAAAQEASPSACWS